MAMSALPFAAACGLVLCLAGLRGADGYPSGTVLLSEGGGTVSKATLLVAYAPDWSLISTVNQSASVPNLSAAAPPAITPDGKYAFQTVSIVDASSANATASSTPVLVTDLVSSTVTGVVYTNAAPANCTFQVGLEATASEIAVGHGHAPGTYFVYGLLVCENSDTRALPSGIDECDDEYLVRYVYTPATNAFVLAEQYNVSHNFDCKTSWPTKDVLQMTYVSGTLYGLGYKSEGRLDNHEAVYSFNTSERVFKTISTTPAMGNRSTCPETVAFALESSTSFYIVCASDNSVKHAFPVATVLPPQGGLSFTAVATALTSPYIFVLAVNTTAYDDGVIGSPATVFAVLKATSELVHRFVVDRGAGGVAVVP